MHCCHISFEYVYPNSGMPAISMTPWFFTNVKVLIRVYVHVMMSIHNQTKFHVQRFRIDELLAAHIAARDDFESIHGSEADRTKGSRARSLSTVRPVSKYEMRDAARKYVLPGD